ncbi:MAG: hypothetical protein ACR2N3_09780 [Pyrinomonadaceae bacterium]
MKKIIFIFILFCLAAFPIFGQKRQAIIKPAPKKPVANAPLAEISAQDWDAVINALDKENWTQAAQLSSTALGKLKADNDKKQLARLRYFYIYALAGKAAEGKTTYAEIEKIADGFIGKEFVMPSRTILADCAGKVNYICAVKDNNQILRVTATDKVATIHSFEYIKLAESLNTENYNEKNALLSGTLEKVELYLNKSGVKIMRLVFGQGFVNFVNVIPAQ